MVVQYYILFSIFRLTCRRSSSGNEKMLKKSKHWFQNLVVTYIDHNLGLDHVHYVVTIPSK